MFERWINWLNFYPNLHCYVHTSTVFIFKWRNNAHLHSKLILAVNLLAASRCVVFGLISKKTLFIFFLKMCLGFQFICSTSRSNCWARRSESSLIHHPPIQNFCSSFTHTHRKKRLPTFCDGNRKLEMNHVLQSLTSCIYIISKDAGLIPSQLQFKETLHQTQSEMQIEAGFMKCSLKIKVDVGVLETENMWRVLCIFYLVCAPSQKMVTCHLCG